jgi:hypothetical protein
MPILSETRRINVGYHSIDIKVYVKVVLFLLMGHKLFHDLQSWLTNPIICYIFWVFQSNGDYLASWFLRSWGCSAKSLVLVVDRIYLMHSLSNIVNESLAHTVLVRLDLLLSLSVLRWSCYKVCLNLWNFLGSNGFNNCVLFSYVWSLATCLFSERFWFFDYQTKLLIQSKNVSLGPCVLDLTICCFQHVIANVSLELSVLMCNFNFKKLKFCPTSSSTERCGSSFNLAFKLLDVIGMLVH